MIASLIAKFIAPYVLQLAIGGALIAGAGIGVTAWSIHQFNKGYARAIHDVAVQNQEAVNAANEVRARVRACNADGGMRWDQVAGECVRRD
jgi:hypothetical protein